MTKRDAGFTLIEALVATAVFVLVISSLYQGLSAGWRGLRKATAEDQAVAVARAELASRGVETPLATSSASGVTPEGIAWQTDVRPYAGLSSQPESKSSFQAFWVTVTVRWREGRLSPEHVLDFTTLKLRKAQ